MSAPSSNTPQAPESTHQRHQNYDKILRENILKAIPALLKKVCGLEIAALKPINPTQTRTKEKRYDFAAKVLNPRLQDRYILHVEFQVGNERKMHLRMFEYYEMIYHTHELPVEQFVIYIGKEKPRFITHITHKNLQYNYHVIDLKTIDAYLFLSANTPEEVLLAILCDFKGVPPPQIIAEILKRLSRTSPSHRLLEKYIRQLEMLSQLRNLQKQTIQQIKAMPLIYDIEKDIRYQQGIEVGIEKGIEKGREELQHEFEVQTHQNVRNALLGGYTVEQICFLFSLNREFVQHIQDEIESEQQKP